MVKHLRPVAAVALLSGLAAAVSAGAEANPDPNGSLSCVQPLDAAALDQVLAQAGSPLAGQGVTFVNSAAAWGIDPRALVAIAAHETILLTYAPAQAIHNPFGIGPHRAFGTDADAIAFAAELLSRHYVGEGRRTLAEIGGKWAPIGAANDPADLNANWTSGVGASYRRLGGNPDAPITLDSQPAAPCPAGPAPAGAPAPTGAPAAGIVAWTGTVPAVAEPLMERGADPATGLAATLPGFVFPLIPTGAPIRYRDDFAEPGAASCYGRQGRCAVTLDADPNTPVAAAVAGTLAAARPAEQAQGLAFWIVTTSGDRVGYSGLAAYAPGIGDGVAVAAGQSLGAGTRFTTFAWERAGHRINPHALLTATRPTDA
jgi:hypothetical protein